MSLFNKVIVDNAVLRRFLGRALALVALWALPAAPMYFVTYWVSSMGFDAAVRDFGLVRFRFLLYNVPYAFFAAWWFFRGKSTPILVRVGVILYQLWIAAFFVLS